MAIIYVGNMDFRSTEANVRSAFEVYGQVENVDIKSTFALVEMSSGIDAEKAISDLNTCTSWVLRTLATAA